MKPNYRRCISCREVGPKEAFWRIVRTYPTREVQLEGGQGRSAYLCPTEACLKVAQKKKRIGRSLKVPVPDDIYEQLWERLLKMPTHKQADLSGRIGYGHCSD